MAQRHDRLARLAQTHVVGQDGAAAAEEKRDTFHLMREEPFGQRHRRAKGAVGIVGRTAEQLREGGGLSVECGVSRYGMRAR